MDLIIIGAGPAGCAAAISARNYGLPVALIQCRRPNGLLPGETLHPGVEPILRQLGVWEEVEKCAFHRHAGLWRVAPGGDRKFEAYGDDSNGAWRGLQVDRTRIHRILQERAVSIGVNWTEVSALTSARRNDQGWTLTTAEGHQFKAPYVMDSTGRRAWLASQLRLQPERHGVTQKVRFGWQTAVADSTDGNPEFRLQPNGWDWIAPIGEGRKAWVSLRRGDHLPGLDVTPRIHRECAGQNWFLLGDAACLTTPASGNGVLRAMMSGIYAAHCLQAVCEGSSSPRQGADAYCSWMNQFWESSLAGAELV